MGLDNDDIKQLIAILQKGLSDDDADEPKPKIKKSRSKKSTQTKKPNKFEEMPEFRMHKEDSILDKKLQKIPPVPRNRNYEPINVRCRVCGRIESVNPSLVESSERFKCNKCSTSSG